MEAESADMDQHGIASRRNGCERKRTEQHRKRMVPIGLALEMRGRPCDGVERKGVASEVNGKDWHCAGCANSRRNSQDGVYCRLFGIMIHRNHTGCKYHTGGNPDEQIREPENDGIRSDLRQ